MGNKLGQNYTKFLYRKCEFRGTVNVQIKYKSFVILTFCFGTNYAISRMSLGWDLTKVNSFQLK